MLELVSETEFWCRKWETEGVFTWLTVQVTQSKGVFGVYLVCHVCVWEEACLGLSLLFTVSVFVAWRPVWWFWRFEGGCTSARPPFFCLQKSTSCWRTVWTSNWLKRLRVFPRQQGKKSVKSFTSFRDSEKTLKFTVWVKLKEDQLRTLKEEWSVMNDGSQRFWSVRTLRTKTHSVCLSLC